MRVAAGSVVLKNLPANCTAVGVPAEVVRMRNEKCCPSDDLDQQVMPVLSTSALPAGTRLSAWRPNTRESSRRIKSKTYK